MADFGEWVKADHNFHFSSMAKHQNIFPSKFCVKQGFGKKNYPRHLFVLQMEVNKSPSENLERKKLYGQYKIYCKNIKLDILY